MIDFAQFVKILVDEEYPDVEVSSGWSPITSIPTRKGILCNVQQGRGRKDFGQD